MAKRVKAWKQGNGHTATKMKVDAVARARGEPVVFLSTDWEGVGTGFKNKVGTNLDDTRLPGQQY